MIIVRLLPPEPFLVGFSTTKVYSGPGSRHCHGINYAQSAVAQYSRNSLAPTQYDDTSIFPSRCGEQTGQRQLGLGRFIQVTGASRSGIYNRRLADQWAGL